MEAPSAPPELPSLGGSLAISFISLGVVCLLAYLALRWLARRGVGQGTGPIRIVGRCPVEPRRSLYVVQTAGRCFLVGASEGGMSLIAELDPKDLPQALPRPALGGGGLRFAEVLARLRGRTSPRPGSVGEVATSPMPEGGGSSAPT